MSACRLYIALDGNGLNGFEGFAGIAKLSIDPASKDFPSSLSSTRREKCCPTCGHSMNARDGGRL